MMWFYRLVCIVSLLLVACGLRQSSEALRLQLLAETPVGSVKTAVVQRSKNERRLIREMYLVTAESALIVRRPEATSYVKIYLGHYRNLLRVDVVAYYLFDVHDRLIDVAVLKETDSL